MIRDIFLGNLCKLHVKSVPRFKEIHEQHMSYTSCKIQDEIIQLTIQDINEIISNEVFNVGFFALMCDEARYKLNWSNIFIKRLNYQNIRVNHFYV